MTDARKEKYIYCVTSISRAEKKAVASRYMMCTLLWLLIFSPPPTHTDAHCREVLVPGKLLVISCYDYFEFIGFVAWETEEKTPTEVFH